MAWIGLRKPREQNVAEPVHVGDVLPFADSPGSTRPFRLLVFLRHVGCPFAEQTVRELRDLAKRDDRVDVVFVSHGDSRVAAKWLAEVGGAQGAQWIDDVARKWYGACGLGYTPLSHFLGLRSLSGAMQLRGRGIRNRSASGTRWQGAGAFLIGRDGRVLWRHVPATADEVPRWQDVIAALPQKAD
ncbi:MAG TPA: hypothetical protein VGK20_03295 [Candidatus Binatia bacterium]|jgi:hypothetical protein